MKYAPIVKFALRRKLFPFGFDIEPYHLFGLWQRGRIFRLHLWTVTDKATFEVGRCGVVAVRS